MLIYLNCINNTKF